MNVQIKLLYVQWRDLLFTIRPCLGKDHIQDKMNKIPYSNGIFELELEVDDACQVMLKSDFTPTELLFKQQLNHFFASIRQ
jgi:hypothetical protein